MKLNSTVTVTYLKSDRSDETLNLGGTEALLGLAFLQGQRTLNYKLSHIILLGQVEQLADLGCSLRSQASRDGGVGQTRDFL